MKYFPFMRKHRLASWLTITSTVILVQGCVDLFGERQDPVDFDPPTLDLGTERSGRFTITNSSDSAYGPVVVIASGVSDQDGNSVFGIVVQATPSEITTLNPGAVRTVTLDVTLPESLRDGRFRFEVTARTPVEGTIGTGRVDFVVNDVAATASVTDVSISNAPATVRQGDVVSLAANASDRGQSVSNARISWRVVPAGAGYVTPQGAVVAYATGPLSVIAEAGAGRDSVLIDVSPRALTGSYTVVGSGSVTDRFTSDLWLSGTTAYTGTWSVRSTAAGDRFGNTMYVWNVADPTTPTLSDSVQVDARVVNDVKIRNDGQLAVLTHEGSNDGLNGVTLLNLGDPLHPTVITRVTETLTTGVHNAWLDADYLYLVVDGSSPTSGLRVIDVSVPDNPRTVASFYAGESFLHDVYVRDGLAFLSHWNAGLIILDVGHGVGGGAPDHPIEVSRITVPGGQTHNAWYWPSAGYVFVGEEDFQTPGIMHVIDVQDLTRPREVATFQVPGTTPHNFWLDESNGVLYQAWYANGVRALDVSGRLMGALDRQGREISGFQYAGTGPGCSGSANTHTCNWAPQFHGGLLYLSDMNTGLWVLRPNF